jgi:hypothetical protein
MKRGAIAGLLIGQILGTILIFMYVLGTSLNRGYFHYDFSDNLQHFISMYLSGISVPMCIICFGGLGMFLGFFLIWFPKGLKPWKAVLIGVLMPFIPTSWLLFPLLNNLQFVESLQVLSIFFFIYGLSGFLGWLLNKSVLEYLRQKTVFPSGINREVVLQIWEARKKWQVSRFDLDRELLGRGYPEIEIEMVWQVIQDEQVFEDEDGDLVVKTRQISSKFGGWRQIALSLFVIHLAGILLTPLFYLPALLTVIGIISFRKQRTFTRINL